MAQFLLHKDKLLFTLLAFTSVQLSHAQNVGIGTNAPAFHNKLHVHDESTYDASIGLTNGLSTNAILRGARFRLLNSDLIFTNYETSGKILFANGLGASPKMVIDSAGNVGIGTTNPQFLMHVRRSTSGGGVYSENFATTGQTEAISGRVYSDQGTAVSGVALDNNLSSSTFEASRYGVLGTVGNIGTAVAGFGFGASTALRGSNPDNTGYALRTSGRVRFNGISEGIGKVLTSDANGVGTWQDANTHDHFGQTWQSSAANGLLIRNDQTNAKGLSAVSQAATGTNIGLEGTVASNTGLGVWGTIEALNPVTNYYFEAGVAGNANTKIGVYGQSTTGNAALFKTMGAATKATVLVESGGNTALELNNGFLKASGTNKTAFTVTTTAGNTAGNNTAIDYANPAATDVVIVTHNWQGNYMGAIGVYWTGTAWRLFREDLGTMPIGEKFNVMVIKQ